MPSKMIALGALSIALSSCATPYQEMGLLGGVKATQITADTFQISAVANAFTNPDAVQRFTLRKAAETTVAAGYDAFVIDGSRDRSRSTTLSSGYATGGWRGAWGSGMSSQLIAPGETIMVRMVRGPLPTPVPMGMYDAREVLTFLATPRP